MAPLFDFGYTSGLFRIMMNYLSLQLIINHMWPTCHSMGIYILCVQPKTWHTLWKYMESCQQFWHLLGFFQSSESTSPIYFLHSCCFHQPPQACQGTNLDKPCWKQLRQDNEGIYTHHTMPQKSLVKGESLAAPCSKYKLTQITRVHISEHPVNQKW